MSGGIETGLIDVAAALDAVELDPHLEVVKACVEKALRVLKRRDEELSDDKRRKELQFASLERKRKSARDLYQRGQITKEDLQQALNHLSDLQAELS